MTPHRRERFLDRFAGPLVIPPLRRERVCAALLTGLYGASLTCIKHVQFPKHPPDFGVAWFGAQALRHGANPYFLAGPGLVYDWPWRLQYPATAFVVAAPFTLLPLVPAAVVFVFLSSALLAYGLTADGWYRFPLFISSCFVAAAGFAQWSILFSAATCLPLLALVFSAKPNIGAALSLAFPNPVPTSNPRLALKACVAGGLVLIVVSLFLLPSWPADWLRAVHSSPQLFPPLATLPGPLILLSLLRWRRWETRLLLAMAIIPQTTYWYEALPLFLIPASLGESVALALVSSLGILVEQHLISPHTEVELYRQIGSLMVVLIYLPATAMILRRPNVHVGRSPDFRPLP